MNIGVVACGAIATHIANIQRKHDLNITIYPLPPLLHNHPEKIAEEVDGLLQKIQGKHEKCVVAYADCGTYGALDEVLSRHRVSRLQGNHCYDVFAGKAEIDRIMSNHPGTYFLTDYLVKSFQRSVIVELGLDRHPELRDDYFKNYTQVLWLAQNHTSELEEEARSAAALIRLPLTITLVGEGGLERQIMSLTRSLNDAATDM
jgi:hypothetical protein